MVLKKLRAVAVSSDLEESVLRSCHLRAADPEQIIHEWTEAAGGSIRIAVVPNANTTYFYSKDRDEKAEAKGKRPAVDPEPKA